MVLEVLMVVVVEEVDTNISGGGRRGGGRSVSGGAGGGDGEWRCVCSGVSVGHLLVGLALVHGGSF